MKDPDGDVFRFLVLVAFGLAVGICIVGLRRGCVERPPEQALPAADGAGQ